MADELLSAELELSIDAALAAADTLGSALVESLTGAVNSFNTAMTDAVGSVPDVQITPDTEDVAPAIVTAVDSADATVQLAAEGGDAITGDIDSAVGAADSTVTIEGEGAEQITGDIDTAVAAADASVTVDADTTEALDAVQGVADAANSEDASVSVDADTSAAEDSLGTLSDSATGASSALSSAGGGARDFGQGTQFAAAGAGIAAGSTAELGTAARGLSGGFGAAAGAGVAFAASLGVLFHAGVETTSAQERFHAVLGETAGAVERVNVGSLDADLNKLAISLGTDDEALQQSTASLFQFASVSGATDTQAGRFAETIDALAARAVALNPQLGSVADVADQMGARLARGGRFAARFGIDLTAAEITARALGDTGKSTAADLSLYEKSAAGAAIATEKYGASLKGDIQSGAENAVIQQRRLREELNNVLETAGQEIVVPLFDVMRAGIPIVASFATGVGAVAKDALPALAGGLDLVSGPLKLTFDVLGALAPVLGPLAVGFLAFEGAQLAVLPVTTALASGLLKVVEIAPSFAAAIGLDAAAIESAEISVQTALPVIGLIVGALAVGATAFGLFGGGAEEGSQQLDDFTKAVVDANGALNETAVKAAGALLQERNQTDDLVAAGLKLTDVLRATSSATSDQRSTLDDIITTTQQLATGQTNLTEAGTGSKAALVELTAERQREVAALRATNPALAEVVAALLREDSSNSGVIDTLRELSAQHSSAARTARDKAKAGTDDASASDAAAQANIRLAAGVNAADDSVIAAAAGVKALNTEQNTAATTFDNAVAAAVRYDQGVGTAADLTNALAAADKELNSELDLLFGRFLTADQASNALKESTIDLNEKLFASGFALDTASKAGLENRDALDQLGQKAISAGDAIFKSTGSIDQAKQPLIDFRGTLQTLRDSLAAAGQDTSFVDGLLANTDKAIAGVGAKAPEMATKAKEVSGAGAKAFAEDAANWFFSGLGNAEAAGAGVTATHPQQHKAGSDASGEGARGFAESSFLWFLGGLTASAATVPGIASVNRAVGTAGTDLGTAGASGAAGVRELYVLAGIDAALGFAAGLSDSETLRQVISVAQTLGEQAAAALRAKLEGKSPSRVFMRIGRDVGAGFVLGMDETTSAVAAAGGRLGDAAIPDLGTASTRFTPPGGAAPARAGGSTFVTFDIDVHGVSDPGTGRAVGEQIAAGAVDALSRRNIVVNARLG